MRAFHGDYILDNEASVREKLGRQAGEIGYFSYETECPDIQVTLQMIEAGLAVYLDSGALPHLTSADELLVGRIYRAMEYVRREQYEGPSPQI